MRAPSWRKAASADLQTPHGVPTRFERVPGAAQVHLPYWRSVIGIEPSTIAGCPALQTPLGSQPRHAPWRTARESNSRPFGRIPLPTGAREPPEDTVRTWYSGWDSNPHCRRSERRASYRLGYPSKLVHPERFERSLDRPSSDCLCRLGYGCMVRARRFERPLSRV